MVSEQCYWVISKFGNLGGEAMPSGSSGEGALPA